MVNELLDIICQEAFALKDEMIRNRRYLHQNPEVGMEIPNTYQFVFDQLVEMGYEPQKCGKSGITALCGKENGNVFLARGDMDALPIGEETNLDFQSTNGNMHACGHDFHTTMLLAAAKMLKKYEEQINGQIKFMFQPGEEIMAGAKDMIEAGILKNPKVDAGMMIHVAPALPLKNGTVIIGQGGKYQASSDIFEIRVKGAGGHGSMPQDAIDPITGACEIHSALHEIKSREVAADSLVALTIGEIAGGSAPNIIPELVIMRGTLRTYDNNLRDRLKKRIKDIAQSVGQAYRCEVEVEFVMGCPTTDNDEALVKLVENQLPSILNKDDLLIKSQVKNVQIDMGSEDFSYISQEIPTIMLELAVADSKESYPYPLHHPKLVLSEDALINGAIAYAVVPLIWLENQSH